MKRLAQTNYLRLRERSVENWFIGGILCLVSILILSLFQVAEIHCQRQTLPYECIVTTTSLVTQERMKIPLSVLRQAKLEEEIDSEGGRWYGVVLEVAGKSILLGNTASQRGDRAAVVQQINQFLRNPNQTELSARVDDRWIVGIIAGVFFLVGMSLISFAPLLALDLDRGSGTLTIRRGNFFHRTRKELPLREIRDIAIESHEDSEGDRFYRVVVHMTSGDTVPLRWSYSANYSSEKKLANLLREFLYLPPL